MKACTDATSCSCGASSRACTRSSAPADRSTPSGAKLCPPFQAGYAPDFLSVLHTVEHGYRAITQADAVGSMTAVDNPVDEFTRKVRTILRGITTLAGHLRVLNPFRFGFFAVEVASHKLAGGWCRSSSIAMLVSSALLAIAVVVVSRPVRGAGRFLRAGARRRVRRQRRWHVAAGARRGLLHVGERGDPRRLGQVRGGRAAGTLVSVAALARRNGRDMQLLRRSVPATGVSADPRP